MMPRHPEVPKRTMSEDYHEGGISDFGFRISDFRPTGQVESPWGGWVENPNSKFRIQNLRFYAARLLPRGVESRGVHS